MIETQAPDNGITGAVSANTAVWMTMVAFSAIALYNVIELSVIIFTTFKRRTGLYFWSFVVSTWGIAFHAVGFILIFFAITSIWWFPVLIVGIGWFAMVTGQSLVLYSRLHLVARHEQRMRWVLYMIIFDAVAIGIPQFILAFMVNRPHPVPSIINAFSILDKVQIGIFFVQESIISGLYIYQTLRLLGSSGGVCPCPLKKLLTHLILVNVLVLIFDATLLGTEYSGNFQIQTTYKVAIYSIKLKIEFSVLNKLVDIVKNKELAFGTPGNTTDSYRLETFINTAHSTAYNAQMDIGSKSYQPSSVKSTEIVMGGELVEIRNVQRDKSVAESQVQLVEEGHHA